MTHIYKPGDKVKLIRETEWTRQDRLELGKIYTVRDADEMSGGFTETLTVQEGPMHYWFPVRCVEPAKTSLKGEDMTSAEELINSMYEKVSHSTIQCGGTIVRKAKRRDSNGNQQYIIAYAGSTVKNCAVKREDIPALVAGLLDIYDKRVI